ncbi:DUF300 domain-containing protein [Histoplasma capsulatum G186AR]|uniref:DUF300 domain-containing protein n=1 Tax=Ajellomyces capsulatus (strain G186AR / H82 / ATCC MYA-2454 / RMSCC 2432) TaxID=447093 RepID=C0NSN7_AJECG|nr:DUF300 domain-containing protein [Histoplasma capsulatum G186AR]EEH05903.1 DUF300 domain-containing protein [Histoplasma capsulatum G186AR]
MTNVSGSSGGTGSSLAQVTVIVADRYGFKRKQRLCSDMKNYRKPLLQRYVVRILLMVPIYSVSSWVSIVSLKASAFIAPIRDIYEAFTIYTFFQLLINLVGGERALIVMTHGRAPVQHAWPLNHFLRKVDISDPHTFLAIKRGILQYAWLKPILALASIIMKATGTYQEGYLGLSSGYLWTGIIYNISVTLSLYSLAMFWWLGALPNGVAGYSPDNLAAAIQDSLICFEMPIFALTHWYAFSWHDYADASVSAARMPVKFAIRDAFGIRDLIEDTKETFRGENYQYRLFDSGDNVIAHEESESRLARVMDGKATSRTPLLSSPSNSRRNSKGWSKRGSANDGSLDNDDLEDMTLNEEDERLFTNARALEFGDYNYPVITANEVPPDQRLPRRTRHSVSNPARNNTESSYVKRAAKHRNRRIHNNEASESSSGRRSNRKSKHSVNGNKEHSSSSISPQSRLRRSQLIDLVDDVGETERERFGAPGEQQNIAKEACLVDQPVNANGRYESIEGRRMVEQPTEQLRSADEDNEADTESLAGRNMAYGSFNEERDAWGG